jgi:hypothetical protein
MEQIVSTRQKNYLSYNLKDMANLLLTRRAISKNQYRQFMRGRKNSTAYKVVTDKLQTLTHHAIQRQKNGGLSRTVQRIKASTDKGLFSVALTKKGWNKFEGELLFFKNVERNIDKQINNQANALVKKCHDLIKEEVEFIQPDRD